MDFPTLTAGLMAIVAIATLYNTVMTQRSTTAKQQVKETEERCMVKISECRSDLLLRISAASAQNAEMGAKISQLRLDFTQHTGTALTRRDLDTVLESSLEPVIQHMQRTEAFIEEVLRAGILSNPRQLK